MNIQEAKEEIIRTIKVYTARDEDGMFRIPSIQQRPLLLMGPPGIGKTAIVEQAAAECGTGMLSYAMTHHTRQSAIGLPELVTHQYEGKKYTVTEYTMSEIVASVYVYMEQTGYREGILFLDEINCVSETLAPVMLQLLQFKKFGTHKVPEGWIIVAAGNPPELNHAVREMDMASLDRVRTLNIEADVTVWKQYAASRGVHPAILSYLEMKPEAFYRVVEERKKKEFVTARGWEDLSTVLKEYERQGLDISRYFMEEFIRSPEAAADFDAYYRIDRTCMGGYRISELFAETVEPEERRCLIDRLSSAGSDVRSMFIRHFLAAASEEMSRVGGLLRREKRWAEVKKHLSEYLSAHPAEGIQGFLSGRERELSIKKEHGLLKGGEERLEQWINHQILARFVDNSAESCRNGAEEKEKLQKHLTAGTQLIRRLYGEGPELCDWLEGIRHHGDYRLCGYVCPEYGSFPEQKRLEEQLKKQVQEMEEQYETRNCI